ncbi:nucleoside triphosphate pyrophosphohydrolase family protein [Bacillus phage 1_ICo-2020]|uniref:Nucleoside triphosphate pyrophosphohydrolase family protein n=1 Tax=Bacillus phage 1_ICo-2020 TaxID=2759272 RepID=A0A7G8AKB5_9CAUD|nr:nucleoside triphosphate pyrophosphohydrolase family protein [Bacillus phage 1_ICo-2020]
MVNLSAYLKYKTKGDVTMDELRINELNDYQEKALRTWNIGENTKNERLSNVALGLAGEGGEVADAVKKAIHHGHGFKATNSPKGSKAVSTDDIAKELGDIMYYVSVGAHELGYTLQEIAEININKLAKRYPEGFSVEASINRVDTKEVN